MNHTTQSMKKYLKLSVQLSIASSFLILTACGGSGGGDTPPPKPPMQAQISINNGSTKPISIVADTSAKSPYPPCFDHTIQIQAKGGSQDPYFTTKHTSGEEFTCFEQIVIDQVKFPLEINVKGGGNTTINTYQTSTSLGHTDVIVNGNNGNLTFKQDTGHEVIISNSSGKKIKLAATSSQHLEANTDQTCSLTSLPAGATQLDNPTACSYTVSIGSNSPLQGQLKITNDGAGNINVEGPSKTSAIDENEQGVTDDSSDSQTLTFKDYIAKFQPGKIIMKKYDSGLGNAISYKNISGKTPCFTNPLSGQFSTITPLIFTQESLTEYGATGGCDVRITFPQSSTCDLHFVDDQMTTPIEKCSGFIKWKNSLGTDYVKETTSSSEDTTSTPQWNTSLSFEKKKKVYYPITTLEYQAESFWDLHPKSTIDGNVLLESTNPTGSGYNEHIYDKGSFPDKLNADKNTLTTLICPKDEKDNIPATCISSEGIAHQMLIAAGMMKLETTIGHETANSPNYKKWKKRYDAAHVFVNKKLINGLLSQSFDSKAGLVVNTNEGKGSLTEADITIAEAEALVANSAGDAQNMMKAILKYDVTKATNPQTFFMNTGGCNAENQEKGKENCRYNPTTDNVPAAITSSLLPFMYKFITQDHASGDSQQWSNLVSNTITILNDGQNTINSQEFKPTENIYTWPNIIGYVSKDTGSIMMNDIVGDGVGASITSPLNPNGPSDGTLFPTGIWRFNNKAASLLSTMGGFYLLTQDDNPQSIPKCWTYEQHATQSLPAIPLAQTVLNKEMSSLDLLFYHNPNPPPAVQGKGTGSKYATQYSQMYVDDYAWILGPDYIAPGPPPAWEEIKTGYRWVSKAKAANDSVAADLLLGQLGRSDSLDKAPQITQLENQLVNYSFGSSAKENNHPYYKILTGLFMNDVFSDNPKPQLLDIGETVSAPTITAAVDTQTLAVNGYNPSTKLVDFGLGIDTTSAKSNGAITAHLTATAPKGVVWMSAYTDLSKSLVTLSAPKISTTSAGNSQIDLDEIISSGDTATLPKVLGHITYKINKYKADS